jgi:hypothetical protein
MCWSGHQDIRNSWALERQTRTEPRADVRVSDADRQATIDQLSRHTGDGRLTLEDFEARVDEAWHATTRADLQHVLRELPVERAPLRHRYPDAHLRRAAALLLIIAGVALLMGPSSLWWLIPLAWFKLGAFGHHHRRYDAIEPKREEDLTLV